MEKLDLRKKYKNYFTAGSEPELVDIEPAHFISLKGKGDPSAPQFLEAIQTLYPVIYTLKFSFKAKARDFVVSKLEALWWYDETKFGRPSIADSPRQIPRSEWEYRLLIRLPDYVTQKDLLQTIETVRKKKVPSLLDQVEYFEMHEGLCVQMLHTGPFDKEPESLFKIQKFSEERNLQQNGLHHEIYLSDFNKTIPEKLKTILREPVKKGKQN